MTDLTKPNLVIYHGNCADGFAAAWCFWSKHHENFDYFPGVYQEPPPDVTGKTVYLVDFSYTRPVMEQLTRDARQVYVIDHHKTAMENLEGLDKEYSNLTLHFDMEKSGAVLAWEFLNPKVTPPRILLHIQDRDLWKFKLPHTREIQAVLFSHEYDFELWDSLINLQGTEIDRLADQGKAIERKHFKDIKELVTVTKRRLEIGGHSVWCASLPYTMVSDAANLMCGDDSIFAGCYWDTADGRIFGLRSLAPDGIDVGAIAKLYGGGGHKHSSGFKVPRDHILAQS